MDIGGIDAIAADDFDMDEGLGLGVDTGLVDDQGFGDLDDNEIPLDAPFVCSVHNKKRGEHYLMPDGQGGMKCKPEDKCYTSSDNPKGLCGS